MPHARGWLIVLAAAALWSAAGPAHACECANRSAQLCASGFVFSAEVVSVEPDDGRHRHHLRVIRAFRGPLEPEIDAHLGVPDELDVWSGSGGSRERAIVTSCDADRSWPVGRLVMLMLDESRYLSVCTPAWTLSTRAEADVDPCAAPPAPRGAGCAGCAASRTDGTPLVVLALTAAVLWRRRW